LNPNETISYTKTLLQQAIDAGTVFDSRGQVLASPGRVANYYAGEYQKSLESFVAVSSEAHFVAMRSNLPTGPNPFAYAGDLAAAILKGTNPNSQSSLYNETPTDLSVLNLPGGMGVQDELWNRAIGFDVGYYPEGSKPDLSGFIEPTNVLARAVASGEMGPYGQLGKPWSSAYGTLSLEQQQAIAMKAETSAGIAYNTRDLDVLSALTVIGKKQMGYNTKSLVPIGAGTTQVAEVGDYSYNITITGRFNTAINRIPTYTAPSFGQMLALFPGLSPVGMVADIAPSVFQGITGDTAAMIKSIQSTPVYSSVERIASEISGINQKQSLENTYAALNATYTRDLTAYEAKLATYNAGVSAYDNTPEQFTTLTNQYNELKSQETLLKVESMRLETISNDFSNPNLPATSSPVGLIGTIWESANIAVSKYTTDTLNIAPFVQSLPDIGGTIKGPAPVVGFTKVVDFAKGAYSHVASTPLELPAAYAGGAAFGMVEMGISEGIAGMAMNTGKVSVAGKILSTPAANTLVGIGKLRFGNSDDYIATNPLPERRSRSTNRNRIWRFCDGIWICLCKVDGTRKTGNGEIKTTYKCNRKIRATF
jgi:hypothetical protein